MSGFDYDFLMLWLAELESGKWLQVREALRINNAGVAKGYCCLGVACELSDPSGWGSGSGYDYGMVPYGPDGDDQIPPYELAQRLGLRSAGAHYGNETQLTVDNDSGKTFAEIAAIVRSRPTGLFTAEAEAVLAEKWGPK